MSQNLANFYLRTGRLLAAFFISSLLLLSLALLTAASTTAQAPEPPAKGSDIGQPGGAPPEAAGSAASPAARFGQIDRALRAKIDPQLLKKLLTEPAPAPFVVYLKQQANLTATSAALTAQGQTDEVGRRRAIVDTLQQTARTSQAGVLQLLTDSSGPGGLSGQSAATGDIRPLWIVNGVAASGALDTVLALAARDDVDLVRLDKTLQLSIPNESRGAGEQEGRGDKNSPLPPCPPAPRQRCYPNLQTEPPIPNLQIPTNWGIGKIRADLVHNALKIDGSGVVVANIDTGVDWQHPALQSRYRGYTGQGKLPQHLGNWYDATGEGATYPIDGNGHGTHTMGTMVSPNGLGVAPGARWIAVKGFSSGGFAQTSWLHAAFQWLLAPNGDPALAPDVVNNSWSNSDPTSTEFQPDIQALLEAGIYPVFSAGNSGPGQGTVSSPASLQLTLAVGATTIDDEIAIFSGRGPSPWGEFKPNLAAPGSEVNSTFPGGAYSSLNGTSMAAPHVAGLAALLLQAAPQLGSDLPRLSQVMTSTAVRLGESLPNNNFGWGRIDAYNAVMSVISAGTLQGVVRQAGSGPVIPQARVQLTPRAGGPAVTVSADGTGAYLLGLAPGQYDATVSAFGYQAATVFNLTIVTGSPTSQNFNLSPAPTGILRGNVRALAGNGPLAATIQVNGTPAKTSTDPASGNYSLNLPVGTYNLTVTSPGHRVGKAFSLTINDGAAVTQDFALATAPSILLVDSGYWTQNSEIQYYQQALNDALYLYDTWRITDPFDTPATVPVSATLAAYDIVVWSSPVDSPGYIEADEALAGYLAGGGKLLLSGQDVAFFDGGGAVGSTAAPYLASYLKTKLAADYAGRDQLSGSTGGAFAGIDLTISGGTGADNQLSPDSITITDRDFARPLIAYDDGQLAGVQVGTCVPYRAMFLSFGFEAISERSTRQTVMEQTLAWLLAAPPLHAVEITPATATVVGNFNSVVDQTFRLRNTGTSNDVYNLSLTNGWPVNPAPPASLPLASCQSQVITVGVRINTSAWNVSDTATLSAQSSANPAVSATAQRVSKSPAPVLLVDDDRFISFAEQYRQDLTAAGIPFDFYQVAKAWQGPLPPSPPLETLQMYPITVWYTGYDWFQPLLPAEEERLAAYLAGGGRLLLSSQDLIYNLPENKPDEFARTYLGVQAHREDYQHRQVVGRRDNIVSTQLGPYPLNFFPGYANNTDALTPTTTAQVLTTDAGGVASGLMTGGTGSGGAPWRTIFLAYGPELLDEPARIKLLRRSVGWLSALGHSTVTPHTTTALDGQVLTYTIELINDGPVDLATAYFTATIPAMVSLNSHAPELVPVADSLVWSGPLARNERKSFTYQATIAAPLPLGTVLTQTSEIYAPLQNLSFERENAVYVNFPDLQSSSLTVKPAQEVEPGDVLTYTLVLRNSGLVDAPLVTATNQLPHMLVLSGVDSPAQGSLLSNGTDAITWTTPLSVNAVATLTYRAVISYQSSTPIDNVVRLADNLNEPFNVTARAYFEVFPMYFPIIFRE